LKKGKRLDENMENGKKEDPKIDEVNIDEYKAKSNQIFKSHDIQLNQESLFQTQKFNYFQIF
jgi:hypothetical protein